MNSFYNIFVVLKAFARKIFGYSRLRIKLRMITYNFSSALRFQRFHSIEEDEIYDYKNNIIPKSCIQKSSYFGNIMYGMEYSLHQFTKTNFRFSGYIEHGLYLGRQAAEAVLYKKVFHNVITFSQFREEIIKENNQTINCIKIGPYINYAQAKDNAFIQREKQRNGKTLLVFPQHSTDDISVVFDYDSFINRVLEVKQNYCFQTVLICLYYRDILLGRDKNYLQRGLQVVSCGYKEDPLFLSRQKTFILLSDSVLSNDVGTYLGYSVFLKKPVVIINDNDKKYYKVSDSKFSHEIAIERNVSIRDAFSQMSFDISDEQYKIASYYWGFDYIKSPKELLDCINKCK